MVATASPGSYFSVLAVAPKSDYIPIIAGMLLSTAVSFVACDAGMGSSAMGASILKNKVKEAGFEDIEVKNVSIPDLPEDVDIVITHESLTQRAKDVRPNAVHFSVDNFLAGEQYDVIIEKIKEARK